MYSKAEALEYSEPEIRFFQKIGFLIHQDKIG